MTEKTALGLTWETFKDMFQRNDMCFAAISEETAPTPVYVPALIPSNSSLPTFEEVASNLTRQRAAKDRKREAGREKMWVILRSHLEAICQQALTDAAKLHEKSKTDDPASENDSNPIVRLLSTVPKSFRRPMFCKRICGTSHFRKMPVLAIGTPQSPTFKQLGSMPLHVQAARADDLIWLLAFKNERTGEWEHQIPASLDEVQKPKTILDLEYDELEVKAASGDSDARQFMASCRPARPRILSVFGKIRRSPKLPIARILLLPIQTVGQRLGLVR